LKILIHKKALNPVKVISSDGQKVSLISTGCTAALWELADRFPDELLGWCEKSFFEHLDLEEWVKIFHHDLIMASYAVETTFLPESIGYVEQLPFANLNRKVLYGTWRMSSDVGGIYAKVLLKFRPLMGKLRNFEYLLNSVAKLGQQNSLFCYSAPGLLNLKPAAQLKYTASTQQLFSFVFQHYNNIWLLILTWCLLKYENKFFHGPGLKSLLQEKFFKRTIDLSQFLVKSERITRKSRTIDVILPTMGRPLHLYNVLKDFSKQTLLPKKVIIVEQNSDTNSISQLDYLEKEKWPFEVSHHFTNRTGACNARNIAVKEIESEWVFFADDDIRLMPSTLDNAFLEIDKYKIGALSMNCVQEGEKTVFDKIKQWGSFGSGTSIVRSSFAVNCCFSPVYEHGYGEDLDFGMQLRNLGCDIIYNPGVTIVHLKAPTGGFRGTRIMAWEKEMIKPKPSPTLMAYAKKHFSSQQFIGYKMKLFLQNYKEQEEKNPFVYYSRMNKKWKASSFWANRLLEKEFQNSSQKNGDS
jgi:hypothetical protein